MADGLTERLAERRSLKARLEERRRRLGQTGLLYTAKDALRSIGRNLAESGYSTAIGATSLLGLDDATRAIEESEEEARQFYGERGKTTLGRVVGGLGRLAGEAAQFMAPGAGLGALGRAGKLGRVGSLLAKANETLKGRLALNTLLELPITAAKAGRREQSLAGTLADVTGNETLEQVANDPLGRVALEAAGNAGAGLLLDQALRSPAARAALGAGIGYLAAPSDERGEGAVAGAGAGLAVGPLVRRGSALLRRAIGAVRGAGDFTQGLDEAVEAGAREGVDDAAPHFAGESPRGPLQPHQKLLPPGRIITPPPPRPVDPLEEVRRETMIERALRAARARRGDIDAAIEEQLFNEPMPEGVPAERLRELEQEPPSTISQLLRRAQEVIAEGQTAALRRIQGTGTIPLRPRPNAPSLRDAIRAFEDQKATALARSSAGMPSAASSDAEASLPRGGSASAKSALDAGTHVLASQSHFSTSDLPSGVVTPRTSPEPSRIQVGGNQKFTVGSLGEGIPNRKILQPTADINDIIRRTTEQLPIYRDDLNAATRDVPGAQVVGVRHKVLDQTGRPNPAGLARLMEKVRQSEARGGGAHYIADYLGGRVTVEDPAAADAVLERLERRGYRIVDDDDFTNDPVSRNGYRARHVQLETPDGTTAELQFMSPEMSAAQNDPAGHAIYEAIRDTSHPLPPEEKARLRQQMQAHFNAAHERALARQQGRLASQPHRTTTGRPRLSGVDGADTEVFFQDREIRARYRVVEADDLIPSNDAFSFERNPAYPTAIQGRAYHGAAGQAAREHVIARTTQLEPKKLLNPTIAVGGPPTITPDGVVVAGNQRSMMLQRAPVLNAEKYEAYRRLLEERASRYGLDPDQIRRMQKPVLVREIMDPSVDVGNVDELRELNALSDMPRQKAKDPLSDANTRAARLKSAPASLEYLARNLAPDETVRQFLERDGRELFVELQRVGVVSPQELGRYVDVSSGRVTEEGKTLMERMLQLAAVPNVDVVKAAPPVALRRLEHSIPAIVAVGTRPEWSLERPLEEALTILSAAKSGKRPMSVRDFLGQADAFERGFSKEGQVLARLLDETGRPTEIAERFRRYADAAAASERMAQSDDLFGHQPETSAEAFDRIFGGVERGRPGHTGTSMMSAIAGAGAGALAGGAIGDTPEERARNAAAGLVAGATVGGAIPYLLRTALGRSAARAVGRGLTYRATPDQVLATVQGQPTPEQIDRLIAAVRANPRARFRYMVRNAAGQAVGTGTSLADFFADMAHTMGRTGAVGDQPALVRLAGRDTYMPPYEVNGTPRLRYTFDTPRGKIVAVVRPEPEEHQLHVEYIGRPEHFDPELGYVARSSDERTLGHTYTREIARQLSALHPDLTEAWGFRVGGARAAHGYEGEVGAVRLRAGAIGDQPAAGSGSPLRRGRVAYRPAEGVAPPPRGSAPRARPTGTAAGGASPVANHLAPDDYLNFATIALDPGGERRLRAEVERVVRQEGLHPKRRVSWEETKRIAAQLGLHPEDLVRRGDVQRLTGAEMLAIRNIVKNNVDALEALSRELATNPGLPDSEQELIRRQIAGLERQNDVLLAKFVRARTQTGRDLNNLKILAEGSLDPAVWLVRAKRMLGERPLTEEVRQEITRLINAGDKAGLATYVAKLRIPTSRERLITLWKAGLLTNPVTHIANFLGNTSMAALETAKDIPAAGLDALFGAVTGQRTKALDVRAALDASRRGARKGFEEAKAIMRGEPVGEGLSRYDLSREVDFDNAFLDTYTKTVFRSLTAADRIFRGMALERSLDEQARVLARQAGFKGEALAAEVRRLRSHPTDEMALRAIHDAEVATFQNQGVLGRAAAGLRRPLGPVGEVILPFTMTPANVATRVAEYSPLGALATIPDIVQLFSRSITGAEKAVLQRKIVERLGRSAIGSLPILVGYLLARAGRLTGNLPDSQSARDQWALEGKQPNAVLVGGKWRSLERVSPLGNLVIFGGHLYNAFADREASLASQVGQSLSAMGKSIAEQSFLTGLSGAMEALKDPERAAGNYLRSTAASVVPAIVAAAARGIDPMIREQETVADAVRARIPFASRRLPARLNQFGEERRRPGRGGIAELFDFTRANPDRGEEDPVVAELERVGAEIPIPKRRRGETPDQHRARLRREGPIVKRVIAAVIASDQYQEMRPLAEVLVARDPRFRGRDPRELAKELQRGLLEDAVSSTRRQLTLAGKEE